MVCSNTFFYINTSSQEVWVLHYSLLLKLSGYVNLIAQYWMKKKTFNQGKRSLWIFSWIIRFGILLDFPRKIQIYTSFSFTTHDNPTGGWDDKRDISHSKGHHQRKANLFPECGIADAYQMQKKIFSRFFWFTSLSDILPSTRQWVQSRNGVQSGSCQVDKQER